MVGKIIRAVNNSIRKKSRKSAKKGGKLYRELFSGLVRIE